jgi:hypothetical protein
VILTCMAAITLLLLSMGCIGGGWAPDTRDGSEGELIELLRKFHQNRCSTFQEESLISQVKSGSWFVFTLGRRSEMQIVGAYERTLQATCITKVKTRDLSDSIFFVWTSHRIAMLITNS